MPFAPFIGDGFRLMQDNARPHVARCVQQYLEEVPIHTLAMASPKSRSKSHRECMGHYGAKCSKMCS